MISGSENFAKLDGFLSDVRSSMQDLVRVEKLRDVQGCVIGR